MPVIWHLCPVHVNLFYINDWILYPINLPECQSVILDWEAYANHEDDGNEKSQNKRFNEQNNSFVHFFAVLCKTTMWNDQVLRRLRNVDNDS